MDSINTLQRIIYGKPSTLASGGGDAAAASARYEILAASAGLTLENAHDWRRLVRLDPMPIADVERSQAVGTFKGIDAHHFLLALAHNYEGDLQRPIYELVQINRSDLQSAAGNIGLLVDMLDSSLADAVEALMAFSGTPDVVSGLVPPSLPTWTLDKRLLTLNTLFNLLGGDRRDALLKALTLLGAALDERGLLIGDFPGELRERLDLMQGLLLLIPSSFRAVLTFSTHVNSPYPDDAHVRVKFYDPTLQLAQAEVATPHDGSVNASDGTPTNPEADTLVSGKRETREHLSQIMDGQNGAQENRRWQAYFSAEPASDDEGGLATVFHLPDFAPPLRTPYLECLEALWNDDPKEFVADLRALELLTTSVKDTNPLRTAGDDTLQSVQHVLDTVAARYMQDKKVLAGLAVPSENLKAVLVDSLPQQGDLREGYARMLLDDALAERDTESALIVTQLMDADPVLNDKLGKQLQAALDDQPDAVYFVVRTHLNQIMEGRANGDSAVVEPDKTGEVDENPTTAGDSAEHWLPRLHTAAVQSLQVAVNDSDANTLTSWLKLIAREPAAYQLGDVLLQGMRAAQERAQADGALGYQLLAFAVKRVPGSVDTLLNDAQLVDALPDAAAHALRDHDPEAALALATQGATSGRELFLVALGVAARAQEPLTFTPHVLREFWGIYTEEQHMGLPEAYRPAALLHTLATDGTRWLSDDALATLMILTLTQHQDAVFLDLAARLKDSHILLLPTALFRSGRKADDVLLLVGQTANAGVLTQQQVVDIYVQILDYYEWERHAQPLAEQVARAAQHNPNIVIATDVSWKLLHLAEESRAEIIGRVMSRRLLADIEKVEEDRRLIEAFLRLYEQMDWSAALRQYALQWWREFVRAQPLARLQSLDKALEGKRLLDEARLVVQTSINLRKVLGKKSLEDFADAIGTAFTLLQAMSDSFDPVPKQTIPFDPATVREEIDARQSELTPDERRVLAKNLRELGGLIAEMAEHRSRATLMRRGEEIERQLINGEVSPHSAIDTMKWLSGYLDGAQNTDDK